MSKMEPGIYFGTVKHKRLRPILHELSYDVASLLINLDDLKQHRMPYLLGYNRFQIFSVHDGDHGTEVGQSISDYAWNVVRGRANTDSVTSIHMLCYPRVLGYAFNPLTVYYCCDGQGEIRLLIYEVHNTFGGRHSYVSDIMAPGDEGYSRTEKAFRVSPFNGLDGEYGLRATPPAETVAVGVALSTSEGPLLKAYFSGRRKPLNNLQLLRVFFGFPLMSLKVILAIHWEALKLWRKGLKLKSVAERDGKIGGT